MLLVRPHHINCIFFFKGLGYNYDFTHSMINIVNELRNNPHSKIKLVSCCDIICESCPNRCEPATKVSLVSDSTSGTHDILNKSDTQDTLDILNTSDTPDTLNNPDTSDICDTYHTSSHVCSFDNKVNSLDAAAMKYYNLKLNMEYDFKEIIDNIYKNYDFETFANICSSCEWFKKGVCSRASIDEQKNLWLDA